MVMIVLCILTIVLDTLGGLAVAMTMTEAQLDANLSTGVVVAFANIFDAHFHCGWLVYVIAFLLAAGVLAEISSWIVGPSRALLETANEGIIPRSFAKTNKHGVSVKTVVVQGVIVTIWDAVLCGSMALAGGSGSSISYLTAVGLTVVIYLVGYVLFFLAYFKLVFKGKDHTRVFQIFGGTAGKCIVAGLGLILTVFALIVSFFPPNPARCVVRHRIRHHPADLLGHLGGDPVRHLRPAQALERWHRPQAAHDCEQEDCSGHGNGRRRAGLPSASTPSPRPLPARKTRPPRTRPRRSDVTTYRPST